MRRSAFSLIELLVVIAILAILSGFLVSAIQRARQAAIRVDCLNRQKQIILGVHQFETAYPGDLPSSNGDLKSRNYDKSFFVALWPYFELGSVDPMVSIKAFICPADPTLTSGEAAGVAHVWCSYAANAMIFKGVPKAASITDGRSQTLAIAEHYAFGCSNPGVACQEFAYFSTGSTFIIARPTFADYERGDFMPITEGTPPVSKTPQGFTFQLSPAAFECDPRLLQTGHLEVMPVAFLDGSTKTISRSIAQEVFWALVTPAGRESDCDY